MNKLTSVKYLSLLALVFFSVVSVNASEVTGNLSSSAQANTPTTSGSLDGTVVSPTVPVATTTASNPNNGGSTSGGSGYVGGGSDGNGQVLGASTQVALNPYQVNIFSSDGTALQAPVERSSYYGTGGESAELALADETLAQAPALAATDKPSGQVAAVSDAFGGIGLDSWIWIALLLVLLASFITYLYRRENHKRPQQL